MCARVQMEELCEYREDDTRLEIWPVPFLELTFARESPEPNEIGVNSDGVALSLADHNLAFK